jgi:hypothetical protein
VVATSNVAVVAPAGMVRLPHAGVTSEVDAVDVDPSVYQVTGVVWSDGWLSRTVNRARPPSTVVASETEAITGDITDVAVTERATSPPLIPRGPTTEMRSGCPAGTPVTAATETLAPAPLRTAVGDVDTAGELAEVQEVRSRHDGDVPPPTNVASASVPGWDPVRERAMLRSVDAAGTWYQMLATGGRG